VEYEDKDTGKLYNVTYSQELQKQQIEIDKISIAQKDQDLKLKRIIVWILVSGAMLLFAIVILLLILQFNGNHLGYILSNLICKQYVGG
jgi:lipopolysaccharide/colanic/teichoic acid biosynthesis glycosyltransferase